jgi:hypothetical protein
MSDEKYVLIIMSVSLKFSNIPQPVSLKSQEKEVQMWRREIVTHSNLEDKDREWISLTVQDLPQHCHGKDHKKCYTTNTDRPQQVFDKKNHKCESRD